VSEPLREVKWNNETHYHTKEGEREMEDGKDLRERGKDEEVLPSVCERERLCSC